MRLSNFLSDFFHSTSDGLKPDTVLMLSSSKKKGKNKQQSDQDDQHSGGGRGSKVAVHVTGGAELGGTSGAVKITLNFKRYIFDPNKQMIQ